MPEKRYIIPLSDIDRMIVRQDRMGHAVTAFSVQLEVFLNGRWHKVIRFDSSHGEPHRHVFYPDGKEYRETMTARDNNAAFTDAQRIVNDSYRAVHERYETLKERMVE